MIPSDMIMNLMAIGYRIEYGYLFFDRYRYGRISEDAFLPDGDPVIPIAWTEIVSFEDSDCGAFGHNLSIIRPDGTRMELKRSELPAAKRYSGLRPNPNGQGFLMPYSISDLMNAWRYVFPDFREKCWKEITTNYVMVDLSLIGEEGLKSLDDPMITRITAYMQDRLTKLGCCGRHPGKDIIRDVFIAKAELNSRNAFLDMMRTHFWDKQPRPDRLFIDVFGARMRRLSQEDSETVLKDVCKCWFLGAVARQHRAIQLDIIPIMIGATGTRKSSAVRWMATVPAEAGQTFGISVMDMVMLGRYPFVEKIWWENPEDERVTIEAMKTFGIDHLRRKQVALCSSGERQRALIAKAYVQQPKLMLVDEPTSHLDMKYKLQVMEYLQKMARSDMTVIVAEHDISLMARYCDVCIIMKKGEIVAVGDPKEIITEDLIRDVYNVEARVGLDVDGEIYVLPKRYVEGSL